MSLLARPDDELNADERRQKLEAILAQLPVPVCRMTPPPAEKGVPCPGEVWLTAAPENDAEAWTLQVIVLSVADNDLVLTVSILPDPAEAGPEDRILPSEFLGYAAAVSFELQATMPMSALTSCLGRLDDADFAALRSGELPHGMTYIDEEDFRYLLHAEMAERIGELQAGIWEPVIPLGRPAQAAHILSFPRQEAIAAAGGDVELHRLATADGNFQLLLSCPPDLAPDCILEVFAADEPSHGLDGGWLADAAGVELAVIEDGTARFDKTALDAGISLFLEGDEIELTREPDA